MDSPLKQAGCELLIPPASRCQRGEFQFQQKKVGSRGQVLDHTAQAPRARPADGRRWIVSRPFLSKSIGR